MPNDTLRDWERVLAAAAHLQRHASMAFGQQQVASLRVDLRHFLSAKTAITGG